jgi:phytoene synthase
MTNQNYLSLYAKSFNWAGFFLPKQIYQKCSALYNFCRVVDNIADDKGSVELKENKFKNLKIILIIKILMILLLKICGIL